MVRDHQHRGRPASCGGATQGGEFQRAELENFSERRHFHDLRHTYASLMLSLNRPPQRVSRWMGHASLVTTDTIYSHLYVTDNDLEREEVGRLLAAQR
ncbi:tyrosine-type recombinase/integrase [Demequina sp.]|uniref:tyrosine-type recombinase/integrase n=1 Tax=Demequina sp. TaxID=2050685 RepID=UPI0025F10107|nr:tyrosine-type recombinase/integrase [Demequina sp.]